jgi:hypothetical protein
MLLIELRETAQNYRRCWKTCACAARSNATRSSSATLPFSAPFRCVTAAMCWMSSANVSATHPCKPETVFVARELAPAWLRSSCNQVVVVSDGMGSEVLGPLRSPSGMNSLATKARAKDRSLWQLLQGGTPILCRSCRRLRSLLLEAARPPTPDLPAGKR